MATTGEPRGVGRRLVPGRDLDPRSGGWGALELGARYEHLEIARAVRDAVASGTSNVDAITLGATWYLNSVMKLALNGFLTHFGDEVRMGERPVSREIAVAGRFSIAL